MTATKHWTIWCDAEECTAWIGQEDTATEARRIAKAHGWKRLVPARDICPEHSGEAS